MSELTRKEKLITVLKENTCVWFITTNPDTINFLTGQHIPTLSILAVSDKKTILIAPEGTLYEYAEVHLYSWYSGKNPANIYMDCIRLLSQIDIKGQVGIEKFQLPAFVMDILLLKDCGVTELHKEIKIMTELKDKEAVLGISKCLLLNRLVYSSIRERIHEGFTELDVYNTIGQVLGSEIGEPVPFVCDILSGERTLEIGGVPSKRVLRKGDTLIVDLLIEHDGYYSDTTRTFFVGEMTAIQKRVYSAVLQAIHAGEKVLKPGALASQVNAVVKESLQSSGFGGKMPHHSGHGVGYSMYESPYFVENSDEILQEGMIVTLEPGVYQPSEFGIRIENVYQITTNGCKNLFDCSVETQDYCLIKNKNIEGKK